MSVYVFACAYSHASLHECVRVCNCLMHDYSKSVYVSVHPLWLCVCVNVNKALDISPESRQDLWMHPSLQNQTN